MKKAFFSLFVAVVASGQVISVGNFIHNVGELDRAVNFYHDVLGMELQGAAPSGPRPFVATPEILNLYNAPGAQFRVGAALVRESPMRAELVEFKDIDREPVRPRIQDPGASIMVLTVRDLTPVIARIKQSGAVILTAGGEPVALADGSRAILVQDGYGFFVELKQPNHEFPTRAPADANFISVSFAWTVSDSGRMARVFRQGLGFTPQTGAFEKNKEQSQLFGISAQIRRTTALVPGTSFQVEFLEFKGVDRKPVHSRLQDPGSGVLRLVVRDADTTVKSLNAVGVKVASAEGKIVKLPGNNANLRAAITSAPDNLYIQLLQNGPPQ